MTPKIEPTTDGCQIPCLQGIAAGPAPVTHESWLRRLKLAVRRRLSPEGERAFKQKTNALMNQIGRLTGRGVRPPAVEEATPGGKEAKALQAGDRVRVRSQEEIERTLNHWRQLKGCAFMPEMQEVDETLIKKATIVVDSREACLNEAGDIIKSNAEMDAEIGEIVNGLKPSRQSEEEITFFKSVGLAVQDAAATAFVLKEAEEKGLGNRFKL